MGCDLPGSGILDLNANNFEEILAGNRISVVDFWAPWCVPCKAVGKMLEDAKTQAQSLYGDGVQFYKVNVDEESALVQRYGVLSLPTVIGFSGSSPQERFTGKTKDHFMKWLESWPGSEIFYSYFWEGVSMSKEKAIDLRSDTVTQPTAEMREAMYRAEVGDDVYGDDPTMNRLEEIAAQKVGKEAAVFVPSGTMGNQAALMAWTQRGDEIITEESAHIFLYEVGAPATLSSVLVRTVPGTLGVMDPQKVKAAIREKNIHYPRTSLICLENTHNRAGGCVIPTENMEEIYNIAHEFGANVHLDGARLFNAACALGVDVKEITRWTDSVQFCLSKGLCAPVGSIVAGDKSFMDKVRRYRKMLGGGMRQAGILAAAGIIALEKMVDRLSLDHEKARVLGGKLGSLPGLRVDLETVQSNMVMLHLDDLGIGSEKFAKLMAQRGVLFNATLPHTVRLVTHNDVSMENVERAVELISREVSKIMG